MSDSQADSSQRRPPADEDTAPDHAPSISGSTPASPRWRRILVPRITSERHAIQALVIGFVLEAATEVYQFVTALGSVGSDPVGYYLSLATTLVGFYFLWRGLHEWNRLNPRQPHPARREVPWVAIVLLAGGTIAAALLDASLGAVGGGDTPPLLAWVVGGVMVLAVGSFFLTLRRMVAPMQSRAGKALGWVAFAWSLGISTVAGLALGKVIVGLFIDFFTSWPALILALAPFIFAIAPLFVTFTALAIGYAEAYRRASPCGGSSTRASSVGDSGNEGAQSSP